MRDLLFLLLCEWWITERWFRPIESLLEFLYEDNRPEARPYVCSVVERRSLGRSDVAVHQRRDEPVQGRFSRYGEPALQTGRQYPKVHPCRWQAQRPG